MGKIGSLFWEITAKTEKFEKGLEDSKSKANKFKDGLNDVVEGLTGLNLGAMAGAGGIVLLGKALADSINLAAETETIQNQLAAVIKSTGGVSGMTAESINAMAEQMKNLNAIDDDAIVSASNVMLTFTKVGSEVFPGAMQAAVDLSTAMGQDLQSSVLQLGKALNDPIQGISALQRVGVSFSATQKEQIANFMAVNDVAGAQRVIIAELNKEFGGSGAAAAKTYAGEVRTLKIELEDLQKSIGQGLLPVLTDGLRWLNAEADAAKSVAEAGGMITQGNVQMIINTQALYNAHKDQVEETGLVKMATDALAQSMNGETEAINGAMSGWAALPPYMQEYISNADQTQEASSALAKTMNEELNAAMQEYSAQLQFQIASEGLSVENKMKLAVAMGLVEEKSRYAVVKTQEWREELDKGNISIDEYNRRVAQLANDLERIQSKSVMIDIWINEHGGSQYYSGPGAPEDQNPYHHAGGGSYTVPPGYIENWPVGPGHVASSGETVTITPRGQDKGSGNTYNFYYQGNATAQQIKQSYEMARVTG